MIWASRFAIAAAPWPARSGTGWSVALLSGTQVRSSARTRCRFRQERGLSRRPRGARIQPHRARHGDPAAAARQPEAAHVSRASREGAGKPHGLQQQGRRSSRGTPARSSYRGVRGISIGKNADTPMEDAGGDYVTCLRKVYAYADYVAVNVSSPEHRASARTAGPGRPAKNRRSPARGTHRSRAAPRASSSRCWSK